MSNILKRLQEKKLIQPPEWLPDNTQYLVIMGSEAYGCNSEQSSDRDIYGWCIPKKEDIFPHLRGEIPGFGKQKNRFDVWQQHHVDDAESRRQYDFAVYNVVRFFQLCMENNPNMVDSLFVPARCVLHCTQVADIMRQNRRLFLHKGCWHKFKGYAYSQMHKMDNKRRESSKRAETVEKFGYDVKFGYHVVRLVLEVEQILVENDLDLERNREVLKAIRRGEWTEQRIRDFLSDKERSLEDVYHKSTLPYSADEEKIKEVLLQILEAHYGSLSNALVIPGAEKRALSEIRAILDRFCA